MWEALMIIISQNGKVAVNIDNVIALEVQGSYIQAHTVTGGQPIPLARFDTYERTQEMFRHMLIRITENKEYEVLEITGE